MHYWIKNLIFKILKASNEKVTKWSADNYELFGDNITQGKIRAKDSRSCLDNYFISLLAFAELKDTESFFRVKEKFDNNYGRTYNPLIREKRVLEMAPDYLPKKGSLMHLFLEEQLGDYTLYSCIEDLLKNS